MKFEVGQKVRIKSEAQIITMYGDLEDMPYGIDPYGIMVKMMGTIQTITSMDKMDPTFGYPNNLRIEINSYFWAATVLEPAKVTIKQLEV